MENLDNQIDTMFAETIYLIEAQNGARIKKFTIRYTKSNQKYSPEHLEALLGSHEKAIREIPRQFLRIEKSARLKYLAPLGEKRQCGLLKVMTDHVEMLVEKMNRKYRDIFKDQQRVEEFDERMKKTLITAKQKMSEETSKVTESLNGELNSSPKIASLNFMSCWINFSRTLKNVSGFLSYSHRWFHRIMSGSLTCVSIL